MGQAWGSDTFFQATPASSSDAARSRWSPGCLEARMPRLWTQAERRVRPLERRFARIARPARVRIRARKPCLRARRRLLGWKVRFMVPAPGERSAAFEPRPPADKRTRAPQATAYSSKRSNRGPFVRNPHPTPHPGRLTSYSPAKPPATPPAWIHTPAERRDLFPVVSRTSCVDLQPRLLFPLNFHTCG